ncbi:MAG TPA: xanthine dehydrogenase family protein molybdopterin-binding subunit, partial [Kofleriaceae bacterium]
MSFFKAKMQAAMQAVMKKAVPHFPDRMIPGGTPDPMIDRKDGRIGAAISRVDGQQKVKGEARFASEFAPEGMVHGALAFSSIAKGRITQLDTTAAETAPGVLFVLTYRNAPRLKAIPYFLAADKSGCMDDVPVMQDEQIYWNGQPIALVIAETHEQAQHAVSLVRAEYETTDPVTSFATARAKGTQQAVFQGEKLEHETGAPEQALGAAKFSVDNTYTTPRYNHNAIEPHAVTVFWKDDALFVHDTTQCVSHAAWSLGEILGVGEDKVHITSPFVGGGFGGKLVAQHHTLAAVASRSIGKPVRVALSREGVYRMIGGRTCTEQRVAIGADENGKFDALIHTGVVAMTAHNNVPEPFISPSQCLYAAKAMKLRVETAVVDMVANCFMRAPGESVGSFALESAIDELADKLGIDPIELRRRNEPVKHPTDGLPHSQRDLVLAYQRGAEQFGWNQRGAPRSRREGEWLIGMGCATATYPYYRMPGGAAKLTLHRDGSAVVEVAGHEMGMGTATA